MLPLTGLRVVSVEQYGAGPFGTTYLADLGAEIIKIENPGEGGELGRRVGPFFIDSNDSHFYQSFNRNKKSVVLDLKAPQGQEVLQRLVKTSDAVLNNLRGDQPGKLGLTYADLEGFNPGVVCVHLSAYGRTGSRAAWPGFDYLMQAEAGHLALTGDPDGPPEKYGLSVVDYMSGLTAAFALLAGVTQARATGVGRDLDVSLFDVALYNLGYQATWYLNEGFVQTRLPRSAHASIVPCQLYRTSDGWLFVMCNKEKFWAPFVSELGHPEWVSDSRFDSMAARRERREELTLLLDKALQSGTTEQWLARFAGTVPVAPVYELDEALDSSFVAERESVLEVEHPSRGPFRMMANPVRVSGDERPATPGPRFGADTSSVLADAGFTEDEIGDLKRAGVVA
ncbi:MAG: succinate--hydroxymethylglutarate CoA-transferase [Gammaproteobacteria bacterium]|jgi:succinate--hydroxymethylglutarate CoA-transferase